MKQKMGGLSDIRTPQREKMRSMPKAEGGDYLSLYMLTKEKERLKQEKSNVDKRKKNLEANLENVEKEIEKLEKMVPEEGKEIKKREVSKKKLPREMKSMTLDY
ncbi:hypothetical protein L6386_00200 [bacterium]|nr:hypothetical protein [bacterium]